MWCFGLLLTYCALQTNAPAGDTYCQIYKPQTFSVRDTRETKEDIDREMSKFKRRCPYEFAAFMAGRQKKK
jgi:hypothetical protein